MRTVRDIKVLQDIPVLVRAALNVPVENGKVVNDYRLRRALPTIKFLSENGARVVLISHIDPPGNAPPQGTETLRPVADALSKLISGISFFDETVGVRARSAIRDMSPGTILVMENLRRNKGEQTNNPAFSKELAELADIFVQDCFDTCHRKHASIIGVPKLLPSYAGFLLEEEVQELTRARSPRHPSLAVIGGMKFSTKEAVLTKLLKTYDHVFVGGALANDFLKASGMEVGKSLVSAANIADIKKLLANPKLVLPVDSIVITVSRNKSRVSPVSQIKKDEIVVDHGPNTTALLADIAEKAKTILWNGPLGNYENGFVNATDDFARAVAGSSAYSVVGGGDTIAAIEGLGLLPRFSFVSTGGGAMLDFLAYGTLPGIQALDS